LTGENNKKENQLVSKIPQWCIILFVIGLFTLALGVLISNTAHINFPEDDWKDHRDEEDLSIMQYLIGATFIHFGLGLLLIGIFAGLINNETIHANARIVLLLIATAILFLWIYFALLSGILSKLTSIHP